MKKAIFTKKFICLCLSLIMILSALPFATMTAFAAEVAGGTCGIDGGNNLTWTLDDAGVLTISGTGAMTNYTNQSTPWYGYRTSIKSVVIDDGVTSISTYAFENCSGLTSIALPSGITEIPSSCFERCSSLASVTIPNTVTKIGQSAFSYCSKLATFNFPSSLVRIESDAFVACNGLTGDLIFPDTVTYIGNRAFYSCSNLDGTLHLSEALTEIGNSAFYLCSKLNGELIFPDSLETIGNQAFMYTTGFSGEMKMSANIRYIADDALAGNKCTNITLDESNAYYMTDALGVLYNKDQTKLYLYPSLSTNTSYVIPDTVTAICLNAFYNATNLTSLTMGSGVQTVGAMAFYNCANIANDIVFTDNLQSIGNQAFSECKKITGLTLGNSVCSLGESAFYNCSSLTGKVSLPETLTEIPYRCFKACGMLEEVEFADTITKIGSEAFYGCTSLSGELKLPANLTSIDSLAFYSCKNLIGQLVLPESLRSIGSDAFRQCSGFTGELVIPDSITYIASGTFCSMTNISKLTLGTGLRTIGDGAFSGDVNLKENLIIPEGVTFIAQRAFSGCSGIGDIYIPASLTTLGEQAFPHEGIGDFVVAESSESFATDGKGGLFGKDMKKMYAYRNNHNDTVYAVPEGVEEIGNYAICNTEKLEYIELPDTLKKIGSYGISSNQALRALDIPDSVTVIGNYALNANKELICLRFGNGITSLSSGICNSNSKLKNVTLPTTITSIGSNALNCFAIKNIFYEGTEEQWAQVTIGSYNYLPSSALNYEDTTFHIFKEEVVPFTCENDGYTLYTCKDCGYSYKDNYVPAHHIEEPVPAVPAKCEDTGLTEGSVCSVCGEILVAQETVPALDHSFTNYVYNNDATCEFNGTETAVCDREGCDATDTRNRAGEAPGHQDIDHDHVCDVCHETISEHKDDDNNGWCDICEENICEHPSYHEENAIGATCENPGYTGDHICDKCGEKIGDGDEIAPLGHSFTNYIPDGNATCEHDGTKTADCDRDGCDASDTVADPGSKKDHADNNDDGLCDTCGKNICEHTSFHYENAEEVSCLVNGKTGDKVCDKCGTILATGTDIVAPGHDWLTVKVNATCDTAMTLYLTCKRCGEKKTVVIGDPLGHDYEGTVVPPTCTTDGYTLYTCKHSSDCESYRGDFVPALGHAEVIEEIPATCENEGQIIHRCTNCGETFQIEKIPALGHTDADEDFICDVCGGELPKTVFDEVHCKMCDKYKANKDKPVIGVFYTVIHFFVHLAHTIGHIT